jgi:predicted RNA-binding protein associated with RNAse of E/G family
VIPLAQPCQVLHFWNADGAFTGWYINLESQKRRDRLGLTAVDWHLDLVISPDFQVEWKDEEEAAAAVETEYLREEDLDEARRAGETIAADPRAFIEDLGRWDLSQSPESAGAALALPPGWDDP